MKFKLALLSFCVIFGANAEVTHNAFGPIKIGERAKVVGDLTDDKSISEARLYFKSNLSQKFSFTELDMEGASLIASLPAPGQSMQNIEYFFAIKYGDGELEQSDVYQLNIDKDWDEIAAEKYDKSLEVYSELEKDEGDGLLGFVDDLKTAYQYGKLINKVGTAVELASYSNYTTVAGSSSSVAASSTASTAATSTAAASTGIGTLGYVGIGAAVVGGAAAAGGGGSSSSSSDDDDDTDFDTSNQGGLTGQAGEVRVFLSWSSTDTDLDLHVTDPCSNLIGFQGSGVATCQGYTGDWDVDAHGSDGTEENITWPSGAPSGSYTVELHHFGGSPTNYTIQVFYGNSSNSYSGSIDNTESGRRTITSFSF